MSQQAQAEGLAQRAKQAAEECLRDAAELNTKLAAGDLSKEAHDAALEEIKDKIEATKKLQEAAADLNLVSDRAVKLADHARKPNMRRPLTSGDDGDSTDGLTDERYDKLSAALEGFLERQAQQGNVKLGVGPMLPRGSRERALVSMALRPHPNSGRKGANIRAKLTEKDWEFLTADRSHKLMNPYVDPDGGWVQAEEMRNEMISLRELAVGIKARAREIATAAARVAFPTSAIAFDFAKRDKTGQGTVTPERLTDVWGKTEFIPHGRDKIIKVPEQLLEDQTYDIINHLAREANRVSDEEDELLMIKGSGASEPLGYVNALVKLYDAGGTDVGVDPVAADGAPTFSGSSFNPEYIQIFHTYILPASARTNAVWTGPPQFERKVLTFREEPGGDNTGGFMWRRAAFAGAPDTLNRFPLLISQFWDDNITSGSTGDPMFHLGDLGDYWWVTRTGLRMRVLDQLYAETSEIGYKWDKRQDGSLVRADGNIYARRQA